MSPELRDNAAREAVRDLGRTLFVEASAGTGKTRLLCDRALEALLTPGYDPAWLVAITFTEKAAAELSARLRAALEAWTEAHPSDEQAARALERFDQAHVSTIHTIAASLLREMPVEAVVDPAFEVVDDVAVVGGAAADTDVGTASSDVVTHAVTRSASVATTAPRRLRDLVFAIMTHRR